MAPYHVTVIPVNTKDEQQVALAEDIYNKLLDAGIETLIDDRNERVGVKFKDAELIGIPLRITVGKKASENVVEFTQRRSGEMCEMPADDAVAKAIEIVNSQK